MSIEEVFYEASRTSGAFAKVSGLQCPPGCGACCLSPHHEATIAEMLPMAAFLWETAGAEAVLSRINNAAVPSTCVMYAPSPQDPQQGRCLAYEFRPLTCRLFGFCGRRDKQGHKEYMPCRIFKEQFPDNVARVQAAVAQGLDVPLIGDHAMKVFSVDPQLGAQALPINQALLKAIERAGLLKDMA